MHAFQPIPNELIEINPFEKIAKEWFAISAGSKEKANTMTASWGGVGELWGRDVVYIFIRESRYTKEFIDKEDGFSCTFFDKSNHSALKYFGSVSGRDEDKLSNAHMHLDYYEDIPYIDEGNMVFVCKKMAKIPITKDMYLNQELNPKWYSDGDYHTLYVGEILQTLAR